MCSMHRFIVACGLTAVGCATVRPPDLEELKPAVEAFHQRVRWRDFRGASDLLVPEHRDAFLRARVKLKDERDLFITDFQLEDARMSRGRDAALAVSKVSWYRLPSNSESTSTVTSTFVWRENQWMMESQDEGPFEDLRAPAAHGTDEAPAR